MNPSEYQLTQQIITERQERFQAVHSIWAKLGEIQKELKGVSNAKEANGAQADQTAASLRAEVADLRKRLEANASETKTKLAQLEGKLGGDAQKLHEKLSEDVRQHHNQLAEIQKKHHALTTDMITMQEQVDKLQRPPPQQSSIQGASQGVVQGASTMALEQKVAGLEKAMADKDAAFQGPEKNSEKVAQLEANHKQLAEDYKRLGTQVSQVFGVFPLHAARACRVALQATLLTEKERTEALKKLDSTETRIREQQRAARNDPQREQQLREDFLQI